MADVHAPYRPPADLTGVFHKNVTVTSKQVDPESLEQIIGWLVANVNHHKSEAAALKQENSALRDDLDAHKRHTADALDALAKGQEVPPRPPTPPRPVSVPEPAPTLTPVTITAPMTTAGQGTVTVPMVSEAGAGTEEARVQGVDLSSAPTVEEAQPDPAPVAETPATPPAPAAEPAQAEPAAPAGDTINMNYSIVQKDPAAAADAAAAAEANKQAIATMEGLLNQLKDQVAGLETAVGDKASKVDLDSKADKVDLVATNEGLDRAKDNLSSLSDQFSNMSDQVGDLQDHLDSLTNAVTMRISTLRPSRLGSLVESVRATDPSVTDAGGDVKDPNKMEDALTTLESHGKESKQLLDQFCQNASERLHARIDDDPGQGSEMLKSLLAQASNNLKESFSNDLRTVTRSLTAGLTTLTLERSPSELSTVSAEVQRIIAADLKGIDKLRARALAGLTSLPASEIPPAVAKLIDEHREKLGEFEVNLREGIVASVTGGTPRSGPFGSDNGEVMHTDLDIHERQIEALEKRLARVEKVASAGLAMHGDHEEDEEVDLTAPHSELAEHSLPPDEARGEGTAAPAEGTIAGADAGGAQGEGVPGSGEANYTATKEETVIYVGKNQGLDNEQTKKMRKKINKLEVNAAQASVEMSDLREALDNFKEFVDESIKQLQRSQAGNAAPAVIDNSTTVVRYDGKALWKEDLERHLVEMDDRLKDLETAGPPPAPSPQHLPSVQTTMQPVAPAPAAASAEQPDALPQRPSPKKFANGTQGQSMQHFRDGIHNRMDDSRRHIGESELLRRVQALERGLGAIQHSSSHQHATFSPEKRANKSLGRNDSAKMNNLQSQLRDMQTTVQLLKRQMTNDQRRTSVSRKASVSGNSMFVGTRCMACDKPVRVRQSMSVPTAAHNSFQPYKALDISVNKKTNHAFPGRTRQMTRSPTMEDKDSGLADVRGGGGPADTDTPKRWYDDTPGAKIPVADMAAPEKVGPILKEGGYRRANKNDRSGMMRTGTENAPV